MSKVYDDNTTKRPYYPKDFIDRVKKIKSNTDNNVYNIGMSITGEFGNRMATMTTGYSGHDDLTNYFIFTKEDLLSIREMIDIAIEEIDGDTEKKKDLDLLREELKSYIEKGYVSKIQVIKTNTVVPNGFHDGLYTAFQIKPVFDIQGKDIDININIGLNYIEFLYLSPNEVKFKETIQYLNMGHDEVEIEFIGYDRKEEIRKYILDAKKELNNFDIKGHFDRKPPTQEEIKKAKDILEKIGMFPS